MLAGMGFPAADPITTSTEALRDTGYRGIWYSVGSSKDEYHFKYSGGLATYPQQHIPIAIYAKSVNKTFFCYGGTRSDKNELLHMVSYYDHATGTVPKPVILLNKKTEDAHENPVLSIDDKGYLYIFSNSHGATRESFVHKSLKPYSIDGFERLWTGNFSYSQPWFWPSKGFLFLHTIYSRGRKLHWATSPDGAVWTEPQLLAGMEQGHYQISWFDGTRLGTAFNQHPAIGGLDARTNLYYLETRDYASNWLNAAGEKIAAPLLTTAPQCLVHDYRREGLLVYLKDIQFDQGGRPVILFLTSQGHESGPKNSPRMLRTAHWTGTQWIILPVTSVDHNYDFASLYLEPDSTWRIIGATEPGPQRWNPGGEIVMWTSADQGKTWIRQKQLTHDSKLNHTYPRRPLNAHPDFYALWADGNAREKSSSRLYFTNRNGDHVWQLPETMDTETAKPKIVW